MKNLRQRGAVLDVVLDADVESGEARLLNDIVGIAVKDGEVGDTVGFLVQDCVTVPKADGEVWEVGQSVSFDAGVFSTAAAAGIICGVASEPSPAASETGVVRLGILSIPV